VLLVFIFYGVHGFLYVGYMYIKLTFYRMRLLTLSIYLLGVMEDKFNLKIITKSFLYNATKFLMKLFISYSHFISESNNKHYHLVLEIYQSHLISYRQKDKWFWIKVQQDLTAPKFEILALLHIWTKVKLIAHFKEHFVMFWFCQKMQILL
jgi:hypothetical protein